MLIQTINFKTLVYFLSAAAYVLIISGLFVLFGWTVDISNPWITVLFVLCISLTLPIFYYFSTRFIELSNSVNNKSFEQGEEVYLQVLAKALSAKDIVFAIQTIVEKSFQPSSLLTYLFDPELNAYVLCNTHEPDSVEGIRFSKGSYLVEKLTANEYYVPDQDKTQFDGDDFVRIQLLASQLIVPMKSMGILIGWLSIGGEEGRGNYRQKEIQRLKKICTQAAIALQRLNVQGASAQLDKELNALTRVAQGISFTVEFDDILELIISQASQVVPADDFRITLHREVNGNYYHVFVSQQNERFHELENRALPLDEGLEIEVIRSQRPLRTDDYARECRDRGLVASPKDVYAWLGVPLNAGAETIGAISIGSRNCEFLFNADHERIMHSIADLTAGAIIKSRLLKDSQHRATQLARLNDISLELTSILDLKSLYSKILENAVQVLPCQAGYLLIIDLQTADASIETTLGPILVNRIGARLDRDRNFSGLRVLDGIARLFSVDECKTKLDDQELFPAHFKISSLLSVPMRLQDRISGAIVLINKQDGALFNQADLELLTAYTNQATIAIENARLYTLTDRALAERVDELSVMQQIDRQLNATLEVETALQITLDWALKQSQADAGMIGIIKDQRLSVIADRGYLHADDCDYQESKEGWETDYRDGSVIQSAINSGQIRSYDYLNHWEQLQTSLLDGVKSQAVIPIRRETHVIGILLLESLHIQTFSEETIGFLSRLSDHAAIALANARLFEEIEEANISKSRFVSFVAHELKNPMASIKGYTELIAGGMAGPVTDMQTSFLATIRSNVDRMNTIVSDLNDLTKIQVGNLRLDCKEVSLLETLTEVTRSLQRQIDDKELTITKDIPQGLPDIWADASRLSQILTNLISNAVKYTPNGGLIAVMAEVMPAIDSSSSEFVHIWIQDHGIGIPISDQKKVFQQYFRTDIAKEMASGTGLGLNITRSLVELQGGKIWFESQPGAGTTFHFTLPVENYQADQPKGSTIQ